MSEPSRRNFLLGTTALGAGSLLAACTSNTPAAAPNNNVAAGNGSNSQPGKPVKIGFSAPAADHGWIAAIAKNAQAQAGQYSDVTFEAGPSPCVSAGCVWRSFHVPLCNCTCDEPHPSVTSFVSGRQKRPSRFR